MSILAAPRATAYSPWGSGWLQSLGLNDPLHLDWSFLDPCLI
jgi:hypothetical protein